MNGLGAVSDPSMDEILASIRKIIAEDTDGLRLTRDKSASPAPLRSQEAADSRSLDEGMPANLMSEEADFDLPSILRPSVPVPSDRSSGVLNRLADALLGGHGPYTASARGVEPVRSLEEDLADLLDGPQSPRSDATVALPPPVSAPAPMESISPVKYGEVAGSSFPTSVPQAQRLLASLDESLALLSDPASRDRLRDLAMRMPLVSAGAASAAVAGARPPQPGFADGALASLELSRFASLAEPPQGLPSETATSDDAGPIVIASMPASSVAPGPGTRTAPVAPALPETEIKRAQQVPGAPKAKTGSRSAETVNGAGRGESAGRTKPNAEPKAAKPAEAPPRKKQPQTVGPPPSVPASSPSVGSSTPATATDKARASVISAA